MCPLDERIVTEVSRRPHSIMTRACVDSSILPISANQPFPAFRIIAAISCNGPSDGKAAKASAALRRTSTSLFWLSFHVPSTDVISNRNGRIIRIIRGITPSAILSLC
jgi:hypothetical protein